jgi:hypothetical protein
MRHELWIVGFPRASKASESFLTGCLTYEGDKLRESISPARFAQKNLKESQE